MPQKWLRQQWTHLVHSALFLGSMALLLGLTGYTVAGFQGILWAVLAGVTVVALHPRMSPRRLLRACGAREVHPRLAPEVYGVVSELARRAQLPSVPRLFLVPSPALNAFAVGGGTRAALALTEGLVYTLSLRELRGVLAHEIGHVKNNDMGVLALAEVVRRLTRAMSLFGLLLLFFSLPLLWGQEAVVPWFAPILLLAAPLVSGLLQLALSRTREFSADLEAVRLTRDPAGLAAALVKLERADTPWWRRFLPTLERDTWLKYVSTHPESRERIRRLLEMSREERPKPRARTRPVVFVSPLDHFHR